jgi:hypothetical protein
MRRIAVLTSCLFVALSPYCARALTSATAAADQKLSDLESRAEKSQPQEQCYLFAELVSQMSDVVDQQLAAGETEKAAATLAKMETYAARIHTGLGPHDKKLKETEILIRHTAQRVDSMFHQASLEEQDALHKTLMKLNALQAEVMLTVFQH